MDAGLIKSSITWCNDKHLKINTRTTRELVVDCCCMSVRSLRETKNSKIPSMCSYVLPVKPTPVEHKVAANGKMWTLLPGSTGNLITVSRWTPRVNITNSVSNQNVKPSHNLPLCSWSTALNKGQEKVFLQNITMSQRNFDLLDVRCHRVIISLHSTFVGNFVIIASDFWRFAVLWTRSDLWPLTTKI